MTVRRRAGKPADLLAALESDGTLAGTRVTLNGVELRNVAAVDLRIDGKGAVLHVSIGHAVIDYGAPASIDVHSVSADVRPSPTPRDPK